MIDATLIRFDAAGLVPVVVQEAATREVLLLAYMNLEALRATEATGEVHFWSRSRGQLWLKGEQSGNRLLVEQIALNCEANSLLLSVRLDGPAACHEGYHNCFYRAFGADGQVREVAPRVFDPATVYGADELSRNLRALYAGYLRLRDEDFTATSATSRRLRDAATTVDWLLGRAREELGELRGVLAGTHVHTGGAADVRLEASQVLYWLCLAAAKSGLTYEDWGPDVCLWRAWQGTPATDGVAEPFGPLLVELGDLLRAAGVSPTVPVAADLVELQQRLAQR
jgi:phosphoribosyl-AMP cyclohydrolase